MQVIQVGSTMDFKKENYVTQPFIKKEEEKIGKVFRFRSITSENICT